MLLLGYPYSCSLHCDILWSFSISFIERLCFISASVRSIVGRSSNARIVSCAGAQCRHIRLATPH